MKYISDLNGWSASIFQSRHEVWTFLNQFSRIISGFIIIAFLTRALESEILGVWYIFVAMFGISSIAELGLGQVFMRHTAYFRAADKKDESNIGKLLDFIEAYRKVYLNLVSLIVVSALVGGLWWLDNHISNALIKSEGLSIFLMWAIYAVGGGVQLFSTYYSAIISGLGDVATAQRNEVVAVFVNSALILFLLIFTQGLIVPVAAFFLSRLILIMLHRVFAIKILLGVTKSPKKISKKVSIIRLLGKDVSQMVLIMLAYQLLTSGLLLIFSQYQTSTFVASYGLTNQVLIIIVSLTGFWIGAVYPEMAACHINKNYLLLRKLFWNGCKKSIITLSLGLILLWFMGGWAINLFGSKTSILSGEILFILILTVWIEIIFGLFAQLLLSQGDLRFAYFSFIGSTVICLVAVLAFRAGYSVADILIIRLSLYFLCVSLPIIFMSQKYLLLQNGNRRAA